MENVICRFINDEFSSGNLIEIPWKKLSILVSDLKFFYKALPFVVCLVNCWILLGRSSRDRVLVKCLWRRSRASNRSKWSCWDRTNPRTCIKVLRQGCTSIHCPYFDGNSSQARGIRWWGWVESLQGCWSLFDVNCYLLRRWCRATCFAFCKGGFLGCCFWLGESYVSLFRTTSKVLIGGSEMLLLWLLEQF